VERLRALLISAYLRPLLLLLLLLLQITTAAKPQCFVYFA